MGPQKKYNMFRFADFKEIVGSLKGLTDAKRRKLALLPAEEMSRIQASVRHLHEEAMMEMQKIQAANATS